MQIGATPKVTIAYREASRERGLRGQIDGLGGASDHVAYTPETEG